MYKYRTGTPEFKQALYDKLGITHRDETFKRKYLGLTNPAAYLKLRTKKEKEFVTAHGATYAKIVDELRTAGFPLDQAQDLAFEKIKKLFAKDWNFINDLFPIDYFNEGVQKIGPYTGDKMTELYKRLAEIKPMDDKYNDNNDDESDFVVIDDYDDVEEMIKQSDQAKRNEPVIPVVAESQTFNPSPMNKSIQPIDSLSQKPQEIETDSDDTDDEERFVRDEEKRVAEEKEREKIAASVNRIRDLMKDLGIKKLVPDYNPKLATKTEESQSSTESFTSETEMYKTLFKTGNVDDKLKYLNDLLKKEPNNPTKSKIKDLYDIYSMKRDARDEFDRRIKEKQQNSPKLTRSNALVEVYNQIFNKNPEDLTDIENVIIYSYAKEVQNARNDPNYQDNLILESDEDLEDFLDIDTFDDNVDTNDVVIPIVRPVDKEEGIKMHTVKTPRVKRSRKPKQDDTPVSTPTKLRASEEKPEKTQTSKTRAKVYISKDTPIVTKSKTTMPVVDEYLLQYKVDRANIDKDFLAGKFTDETLKEIDDAFAKIAQKIPGTTEKEHINEVFSILKNLGFSFPQGSRPGPDKMKTFIMYIKERLHKVNPGEKKLTIYDLSPMLKFALLKVTGKIAVSADKTVTVSDNFLSKELKKLGKSKNKGK